MPKVGLEKERWTSYKEQGDWNANERSKTDDPELFNFSEKSQHLSEQQKVGYTGSKKSIL